MKKIGPYCSYLLRGCLICSFAVLVGACSQRFEQIHVLETSEGISFYFPAVEAGLERGRLYELLDLSVMSRECLQECMMWLIARKSSHARTANLEAARLAYGMVPIGMDAKTPAKPLSPGSYFVSATIQQYDAAGQFSASLSLDGLFSIDEDESGRLRVVREGSAGDALWAVH